MTIYAQMDHYAVMPMEQFKQLWNREDVKFMQTLQQAIDAERAILARKAEHDTAIKDRERLVGKLRAAYFSDFFVALIAESHNIVLCPENLDVRVLDDSSDIMTTTLRCGYHFDYLSDIGYFRARINFDVAWHGDLQKWGYLQYWVGSRMFASFIDAAVSASE